MGSKIFLKPNKGQDAVSLDWKSEVQELEGKGVGKGGFQF